jgi:hypothetical protein
VWCPATAEWFLLVSYPGLDSWFVTQRVSRSLEALSSSDTDITEVWHSGEMKR